MLTPYHHPELQEQPPSYVATDAQTGASELPEGVNWVRIFSALGRYKWLILLVIAVGSAAGVVSTRFMTPPSRGSSPG